MVQEQDLPLCPACKKLPRFCHPETYNLWGYCKPCTRVYQRKYYRKNEEDLRGYYRNYYKRKKAVGRTNFDWEGTYLSRIYNTYVNNAKIKNLEWRIGKDVFLFLSQSDCAYCDIEPQVRGTHNGHSLSYNGLDRVDNNKGYVVPNVVPCCKKCNWMKNTYSREEFIDHCKKIVEHTSSPFAWPS